MIEYCSCGLPLHGLHLDDDWQHVSITSLDTKEIYGYKEPEEPELVKDEEIP